MIEQVNPRLVITTGTAGGVGSDVLLGDVIVARTVRSDATLRFPSEPWAHTTYTSPAAATAEFDTATATLIPVHATHLPAAARPPVVWLDTDTSPAHTISTDFFAFDDAALGLACTDLATPPPWVRVRNASDPQMNAPTLAAEKKQAAAISEKYGYRTSVGSVIACWAIITNLP